MEIKEFLKNFASQYDDIEVSDISPDMPFRDIEGWSSLTALSVIAMVDEVYKLKLTGDDIRSSVTIEDIYNILNSRL